FCPACLPHRPRHSFPTRRSSDLLGNLGDRRSVEPLARALADDPEPLVRGHAAWALGRIGGDAARLALGAAAGRETSKEVMTEIQDRKSTRLNSSHGSISYAVFCL